ncbi:MAG: pyridoxamine 5'-phosphate oxidase family protein [Methanobacterium sp.]
MYTIRRQDKEIKDQALIRNILHKAKFCRIGLSDDNKPYIVPMNFVFKTNRLYLHSAREGRKIEIIRKNNNVCFEIDIKTELITSKIACDWSMRYLCIIGYGKAHLIIDSEEKRKALDIIMDKYSPDSSFDYSDDSISKVIIIEVKIMEMTGKKSGY